jgi:Ketosteroid isomerase homolog
VLIAADLISGMAMPRYRGAHMNDGKDKAANVLDRYRAAVFNKNVESMLDLYADNVRVFDAWNVWEYDGALSWRLAIEQWFGSLQDEAVEVGVADVRADEGSDLAFISAVLTYTAVSGKGVALRSIQNRLTWVLTRRDEMWRIVHEHTSAPIGFEDLKAIIQR